MQADRMSRTLVMEQLDCARTRRCEVRRPIKREDRRQLFTRKRMVASNTRFTYQEKPCAAHGSSRESRAFGNHAGRLRDECGRKFAAREHPALEVRLFLGIEKDAALARQCREQ